MKKKLITMLLSLSMLLGVGGLAACDKESSSPSTESSSPTGDSSSGGGDSSSSSGSGDSSGGGSGGDSSGGSGGGSGGGQNLGALLPPTEGLVYELSYDETYYTVTGIGTATATDIVIPATYNNVPVTEIGSSAFYDCSSLTSVTIPDSVTFIGYSAFYYCSSLTSVTIPDSVTSIRKYAFWYCNGIIQKENGVSYVDKWIVDCDTSVTSVTLRANTKGIADYAFRGCSSLTSITIPDGVTSIGEYAFEECTSLTSITIPDGVTSIGEYAFEECTSLTNITIPDSVISIGYSAFEDCDGVKQWENGVYYVDKWVVTCDASVTSVTLRANTKGIADNAFAGCNNLLSVSIPDSVISIGEWAFLNCRRLTSVSIPDSVIFIGEWAFLYCDSLTSVTFENPNGWKADGAAISASDLQNTATAATYLTDTYDNYTWTRVDE